jgi:hypothetical protein
MQTLQNYFKFCKNRCFPEYEVNDMEALLIDPFHLRPSGQSSLLKFFFCLFAAGLLELLQPLNGFRNSMLPMDFIVSCANIYSATGFLFFTNN